MNNDVEFEVQFIKKVIAECGPRLPGSEQEKKAAVVIAAEFEKYSPNKAIIEEFTCTPTSTVAAIPILGYVLLFGALPLNFLFPIINLFLTPLLLLFALSQIFKYAGWFDVFFPKKKSQNLYTMMNPPPPMPVEKTLVFSAHIDSCWNWNLALKRPTLMWVKVPLGIVGGVVLLVLAVLQVLDAQRVLSWWTPWLHLTVIPFVPGFWYITHFLSLDPAIASPGAMDNLSGMAVVLWLEKHFKENPDKIPANCRLIFAGFGAEEAGDVGSKRFVERHRDDLLHDAWVFNIDSISDFDHFIIVAGDSWLGTNYDPALVGLTQKAMQEMGVKPAQIIKNPVGGTDGASFAKAGIPVVTITAQNPVATDYYHTRKDTLDRLDLRSLEKINPIMLRAIEKWTQLLHGEEKSK